MKSLKLYDHGCTESTDRLLEALRAGCLRDCFPSQASPCLFLAVSHECRPSWAARNCTRDEGGPCAADAHGKGVRYERLTVWTSCVKDKGRPLGIGFQEQVSNHSKVLRRALEERSENIGNRGPSIGPSPNRACLAYVP